MISIIIPVYNVSQYIDHCLQSVKEQSYTDWECILVDDGSKDDSGEKCDEWCKCDSRFHVIHQPNHGVSAARNNALRVVKGEWVTFIDSDDWLEKDYLSLMLNETVDVDLVVSGQIREFANNRQIIYVPDNTEVFPLTSAFSENFNNLNKKFLLYAPHEKLFKVDIIRDNNLQFDVCCSYGEDLQFVYQYLEHTTTIATVNHALYHYRMGDGNTLSTKLRIDQFEVDYKQWQIVYDFYQKRDLLNDSSNQYLANRLWGIVYDGIFLLPRLKCDGVLYLKNILNTPEIRVLRSYSDTFETSLWIKWCIVHRFWLLFYIYFKLL